MEGKTNPNYPRVVPRDLFNESKLLKCLARLVLLIHEGKLPQLRYHDTGHPFDIALHEAGYLTVVRGLLITRGSRVLWLGTVYNNKASYPFYTYDDELGEILVFEEDGTPTAEFTDFCNGEVTPGPAIA